jgi:AcrR family transcriptional regulator
MRYAIVIQSYPGSGGGAPVSIAESGSLTRRERQRAATVEEIKEVARGLMREHGASEVRFTDIAKEMGMTPPALYRYYADRDELLTDLIADGYRDLGRTVAAARETVDQDDVAGRWIVVGKAYRDWARSEPAQFALILGMPLPGYVAPEDGPTTDAAKDAMGQLAQLFLRAAELGVLSEPLVREVADELVAHFEEKDELVGDAIPPATHQAMLHAWATLHGVTCLDVYGQFDWMGEAARDALFDSTLRSAALAAGFPVS